MKKILVVDDEEDLCEILRFDLEHEGYAVDTATSAEEAMGMMAEGGQYDLVLLDVMMGGMSGYEMLGRMRTGGDDTPVIFLTARDSHDDQLKGFRIGADDYITKPFSIDTVMARVNAVIRRTAGQLESEIASLTKMEQMIYRLFATNRGRLFSRMEIMDAVWPDDTCVSERTIDVHIARLRKKLGESGQQIVNKTGVGYGMV